MAYIPGERLVHCACCTKRLYRKDCWRNVESKALVCRECYDAPIRKRKVIYNDPRPLPHAVVQPVPTAIYGGIDRYWNTIVTNWEDLTMNWEDLD